MSNIFREYREWASSKKNLRNIEDIPLSYDEGDRVYSHKDENSLESLLELHKSGELNANQKTQLVSLLKSDITTFKSNDPSFQKFQYNLAQEAAATGTDFYIQSALKTEEDIKKAEEKGIYETQGQNLSGISTEEEIEKRRQNPELYGSLVDDSTYRGGTLGVYKTTGEDVTIGDTTYSTGESLDQEFLMENAYNQNTVRDQTIPNIAGCGDNMTCITSQTYLMNDAIDAWNKIEGNPSIELPLGTQNRNDVTTSHPVFWGNKPVNLPGGESTWKYAEFGERGMNENDRNFLTTTYNKSDFYYPDEEDDEGNIIKGTANPEAVANFFKNMQQGTIMGVHSGGHRGTQSEASSKMPGHAIMYGGGARYQLGGEEYKGLDFSTKKGYEESLAFLQSQGEDLNLQNIQFLNLQDPTANSPFQYRMEQMDEGFWTEGGNIKTSSFQGNPVYRDWYNKTYTQPLKEKQNILSQLTADPEDVNTQLGTDYEIFKGSKDIYSKIEDKKVDKISPVNKTDQKVEVPVETRPTSYLRGEQGYVPDWMQPGVNRPEVPVSQQKGDKVKGGLNIGAEISPEIVPGNFCGSVTGCGQGESPFSIIPSVEASYNINSKNLNTGYGGGIGFNTSPRSGGFESILSYKRRNAFDTQGDDAVTPIGKGTDNISLSLGKGSRGRASNVSWRSDSAPYRYGINAEYDLTNKKLSNIGLYGQYRKLKGSLGYDPTTKGVSLGAGFKF